MGPSQQCSTTGWDKPLAPALSHPRTASPTEIEAFQRLVPHLRRAVDLNSKFATLKATSDATENALDLLDFGVVFVGDRGLVVRANSPALAMVTRANGLQFFGGRLRAVDAPTHERLSYLIDCAVRGRGPRGGSLYIPRSTGAKPLFVRVLPYVGASYVGVQNVRALLYLRDPEASFTTGTEHIAAAYGLTAAECRVLSALVQEPDVTRIAEEFELSIATVRNQVARILAKTGTSKQSELIRLVLSTRLPLSET